MQCPNVNQCQAYKQPMTKDQESNLLMQEKQLSWKIKVKFLETIWNYENLI